MQGDSLPAVLSCTLQMAAPGLDAFLLPRYGLCARVSCAATSCVASPRAARRLTHMAQISLVGEGPLSCLRVTIALAVPITSAAKTGQVLSFSDPGPALPELPTRSPQSSLSAWRSLPAAPASACPP